MIYTSTVYALLETLLAPVTHNDPRDPYVVARDAATAPATDTDDAPTQKETSPSEPQGSPPHDSYCSRMYLFRIHEITKLNLQLVNLKVKEFDITAYTKRFHELVQLCPEMVPSERKK
ncbi:hypothetical protein Tco_0325965, partial [Tanacetum coccineum]